MWFITFLNLFVWYVQAISIYHLWDYTTTVKKNDVAEEPFLYTLKHIPYSFIILLLAFIGMFFTSTLYFFHIFLIFTGQTTNEQLKSSFPFSSPFNHGIFRNLINLCCITQKKSRLHRARNNKWLHTSINLDQKDERNTIPSLNGEDRKKSPLSSELFSLSPFADAHRYKLSAGDIEMVNLPDKRNGSAANNVTATQKDSTSNGDGTSSATSSASSAANDKRKQKHGVYRIRVVDALAMQVFEREFQANKKKQLTDTAALSSKPDAAGGAELKQKEQLDNVSPRSHSQVTSGSTASAGDSALPTSAPSRLQPASGLGGNSINASNGTMSIFSQSGFSGSQPRVITTSLIVPLSSTSNNDLSSSTSNINSSSTLQINDTHESAGFSSNSSFSTLPSDDHGLSNSSLNGHNPNVNANAPATAAVGSGIAPRSLPSSALSHLAGNRPLAPVSSRNPQQRQLRQGSNSEFKFNPILENGHLQVNEEEVDMVFVQSNEEDNDYDTSSSNYTSTTSSNAQHTGPTTSPQITTRTLTVPTNQQEQTIHSGTHSPSHEQQVVSSAATASSGAFESTERRDSAVRIHFPSFSTSSQAQNDPHSTTSHDSTQDPDRVVIHSSHE